MNRFGRKLRVLAGAVLLVLGARGAPAGAQTRGKTLYKAKCAGCHAPDGAGATAAGKAVKAPNLCSVEAKKVKDADWTEIIAKGKDKMPAYGKSLSKAEIKAVIVYTRSLCKK